MEFEPLAIAGAVAVTPAQFGDERGKFMESFRPDKLAPHIGHLMSVLQTNTSISRRGVVRGVHFALVPPGQAKYVSCLAGTILDIVVDIRVGSPTFGEHLAVELDDVTRRSLYLGEGLGHAFCALSDSATVNYLCSTPYNPDREFSVHPLDPDLQLPWPVDEPVLSARDAAAPSFAEAQAAGTLPTWADTTAFLATLTGSGRR